MGERNLGRLAGTKLHQAATKRLDAVVSARSLDLVDEKANRTQLLSSVCREDQGPAHEETDWVRPPKVVQAGSEADGLTMTQVEAQVSIRTLNGASSLATLARVVMLAMLMSTAT